MKGAKENAKTMTTSVIEIKCATFWLMFELIATFGFFTFVIGYVILGRHLHRKCIKGSTVLVSDVEWKSMLFSVKITNHEECASSDLQFHLNNN